MKSYNRLNRILSSFKIYDCDNTFIKGELLAYSAGVDFVDNELKTMEREYFVNTSQDYGISEREKLFDSIERPSSIADRRKMLINALSLNRTDFNREGMIKYLGRFPTNFSIEEKYSTNTLTIEMNRNGWVIENLKHIKDSVNRFFPAHIQVNILVTGIMWQEIEEKNMTFKEMEDRNWNWTTIDKYTPNET
ncbi:MAG: hypothetical protein J1F17_02190 [Oscillospiraceae bacterium]|nr:hypothetical protein [Oscillospiraceae bacterium]